MKKIIIGFCIVSIILSPCTIAINDLSSENVDITEQQSTNAGLPDLIIEDIYYYPHDPGSYFYYVEADIKNQGNEYAYGDLTVEFSVVKTLFWFFNIRIIYDNIEAIHLYGGLAPGETRTTYLSVGDFQLPFFLGFFKFNAAVNLDKKIDESNYNNNKLTERVFCFFGMWL